MIIEINRPEVEALIQERLRKGGFSDPEDVILYALRALENLQPHPRDLLAALQSSPAQDAGHAPAWLKNSWINARESGLDAMSMKKSMPKSMP
jgi:hypothetical protein